MRFQTWKHTGMDGGSQSEEGIMMRWRRRMGVPSLLLSFVAASKHILQYTQLLLHSHWQPYANHGGRSAADHCLHLCSLFDPIKEQEIRGAAILILASLPTESLSRNRNTGQVRPHWLDACSWSVGRKHKIRGTALLKSSLRWITF